jgi:hypothetical protein
LKFRLEIVIPLDAPSITTRVGCLYELFAANSGSSSQQKKKNCNPIPETTYQSSTARHCRRRALCQ